MAGEPERAELQNVMERIEFLHAERQRNAALGAARARERVSHAAMVSARERLSMGDLVSLNAGNAEGMDLELEDNGGNLSPQQFLTALDRSLLL